MITLEGAVPPGPSGRPGAGGQRGGTEQQPLTKEDAMLRSMKALDGCTIGATDGDVGTVTDG